MKCKLLMSIFIGVAFIVTNTANAGLIDRGNGLIYDDVQDITWLADANYAQTSGYDVVGQMTWQQSLDWAAQLSFGGFDDWRLFDAPHNDPGCSFINGEVKFGFNCTDNELAYMFYNYFGLSAKQDISLAVGDAEFDLFSNVQSNLYWSATEYELYTTHAKYFAAFSGYQSSGDKGNVHYAWAVRDGDVGAREVPEPASIAIFALGLMGLASRRFKKQM